MWADSGEGGYIVHQRRSCDDREIAIDYGILDAVSAIRHWVERSHVCFGTF